MKKFILKERFAFLSVIYISLLTCTSCVKESKSNMLSIPSATKGIGAQIWASKNLDVANYTDGTAIPQVMDSIAWRNPDSADLQSVPTKRIQIARICNPCPQRD